jgi:hypothetical protein
MREQNTEDENTIPEYQQRANLWAQGLGISDVQCLAVMRARIEEILAIGTNVSKSKARQ